MDHAPSYVGLTILRIINVLAVFAVLACLRSVRNRSRSRAFVCQSVIPSLTADDYTPSISLNLGLWRLLFPCGRPLRDFTGWVVHFRAYCISKVPPILLSFWASSSQKRPMWVLILYRCYIVPASSVATGSMRWIDFSGCRMTDMQPASLHATDLAYDCRC